MTDKQRFHMICMAQQATEINYLGLGGEEVEGLGINFHFKLLLKLGSMDLFNSAEN